MPMLDVGDWVYFQNMGAYTLAAGSTFNGMPRPNVVYFIEDAQFELVKMFEQESVQMAWKNNDVPKVNAKKVKRFRISTFPS